MSRTLNMCIVNPDLVEEIRKLVGSQAEIMTRVGISWNSWTKIASGMPVRLSVGERLRSRVIGELRKSPAVRRRFPCASGGGLDEAALEAAFLTRFVVPGGRAGESGRAPEVGERTSAPVDRAERVTAARPRELLEA